MSWLRQITGVSLRQELSNPTIHRLSDCPVKLSELCRQYRLRYYGHLCRMKPGRLPQVCLTQPAPVFRRQGRPTRDWLTTSETDAATRGLTLADLQRLSSDPADYRRRVIYAPRIDGQATSLGAAARPRRH